MLGIKYLKFDPTTYVFRYKKGQLKEEGKGLSFFTVKRTTSIIAIPIASKDVQFIFSETTNDFQQVTVQGRITFKIQDPKKISEVLDFTVDTEGIRKTRDDEKIEQRLVNEAQTASTSFIQGMPMTQAITNAKLIQNKIFEGVSNSETVKLLGLQIMGVNITSVKPTPEMARALETSTREKLQQEADEAIYMRRKFAVEQERIIKETELSTEIAVEEKQKQISEKKMERQRLEEENNKTLRLMKTDADIEVEQKRKSLIDIKIENENKLSDSLRYKIKAQLEPYKDLDWHIIAALNSKGNAKNDIAIAFRELAENAQNIQNLNITPDLLNNLIEQK